MIRPALLLILLCGCFGEAWRGFRPYPATEVRVRTPAYQTERLPNGVVLMVYEGGSVPLASIQIALRAGSAAAEAGLAQLTYDLLRDGTLGADGSERDAVALAEAFDAIGATPQVQTTPDGAYLSVQVLPPHAERALQLLSDMVRRPRFAERDLEEERTRHLEALTLNASSPAWVATRALQELIYGASHPYGRSFTVTPAALRRLSRRDVAAFYRRYVGPRNVAVILTGVVRFVEALEWTRRGFADWQAAVEDPAVPPPPPVAERRLAVVPKPGLVQTRLAIGRATVAAGDPAERPLRVASVLYGDRLSWELREAQGYTYGATSGLVVYRGVGHFAASTAVQADATGAALQEALDQLTGLRGAQLRATEVYRARADAVWATMGLFRTIEGLGRAAGGLFLLHQPIDGYHRLVTEMQGVEPTQVEVALMRYFNPATMQIVLVGDPALIQRQVAPLRLGPVLMFAPDGRPAAAR